MPEALPLGAADLGLVYHRSQAMHFLKRTLGYSDDGPMNKVMATLVGSKEGPRGTLLRNSLLERHTTAPKWLLELLQEYAENDLGWSRSHGWPEWLKGAGGGDD